MHPRDDSGVRCRSCGEWNPEGKQLCALCGHSLVVPPRPPTGVRVAEIAFGTVFLVALVVVLSVPGSRFGTLWSFVAILLLSVVAGIWLVAEGSRWLGGAGLVGAAVAVVGTPLLVWGAPFALIGVAVTVFVLGMAVYRALLRWPAGWLVLAVMVAGVALASSTDSRDYQVERDLILRARELDRDREAASVRPVLVEVERLLTEAGLQLVEAGVLHEEVCHDFGSSQGLQHEYRSVWMTSDGSPASESDIDDVVRPALEAVGFSGGNDKRATFRRDVWQVLSFNVDPAQPSLIEATFVGECRTGIERALVEPGELKRLIAHYRASARALGRSARPGEGSVEEAGHWPRVTKLSGISGFLGDLRLSAVVVATLSLLDALGG